MDGKSCHVFPEQGRKCRGSVRQEKRKSGCGSPTLFKQGSTYVKVETCATAQAIEPVSLRFHADAWPRDGPGVCDRVARPL